MDSGETKLYPVALMMSWAEYKLLQSRMLPQDHELATKLAAAMDVGKATMNR